MQGYELAIIGLCVSFGGAGLGLLGMIVKLLTDTLQKLTREIHCTDRKVEILANALGCNVLELRAAAAKEIANDG